MDRDQKNIELFRAVEIEELEARLQGGYSGLGDLYYGCCIGTIN